MLNPPSAAPKPPTDRSARSGRRQLLRLLSCGLLLLPAGGRAAQVADVYRFGVFPYLPALKLEELMGPVARSFASVLGADVQLKSRATFEAFRADLLAGRFDVALVHPFLLVEASVEPGYVPLAKPDEELRAILVSQALDPLQDLTALRGRTVALPPRLSGASYLVTAALVDAGLEPGSDVALRYYPDKVSCLHAVAIGAAAVCGIPSFLAGQLDPLRRMQLRPVWRSEPVANLAFVAHPRLSPERRRALQRAMLAWDTTPDGKALLAALGWTALVPARDADYDSVRSIHAKLRAYATG